MIFGRCHPPFGAVRRQSDYILYGWPKKRCWNLRPPNGMAGPALHPRLCYIAKTARNYMELPAYETVAQDKVAFIEMFHRFYRNNDPSVREDCIRNTATATWSRTRPP